MQKGSNLFARSLLLLVIHRMHFVYPSSEQGMSLLSSICRFHGRLFIAFTVSILIVFAGTSWCYAQKDAGAIADTVHDPSGAVIEGVTLAATDVDRGVAIAATSNASGEYVISPLKRGGYVIKASRPGFNSVVSTPITLQVQQRLVFDVTLTVGAVNQSVTLTDSTAQLQTETPILAK
jgi:hypothetical protein